jgi:hypothetical protein
MTRRPSVTAGSRLARAFAVRLKARPSHLPSKSSQPPKTPNKQSRRPRDHHGSVGCCAEGRVGAWCTTVILLGISGAERARDGKVGGLLRVGGGQDCSGPGRRVQTEVTALLGPLVVLLGEHRAHAVDGQPTM